MEEDVDARERAAAAQRERPARGAVQSADEVELGAPDPHRVGVALDLEQRAVDIEEERPIRVIGRHCR